MQTRLDRRQFVQTLAAAGAIPSTATLAAESTPLRPVKIIDTHTHFYDPSRSQGVPWPPKDDALLYRTVMPKDYAALSLAQRVDGTVVVEASAWLEDNQWILDLAAKEKFIVGFVGNLPVGTAEFRPAVKRFSANRLFSGIRISGATLKAGLGKPAFLADLSLLADANLSLDLVHLSSTWPEIAQLAQRIPALRIIIDHVANVSIDGKEPPGAWAKAMREAGASRNVFCKVSGLVEGTNRKDGSAPKEVGFYRPVLETIWQSFGAERLIYGSNWPVSERFASPATVQQIVLDYFSGKGQNALDQVFWQNAISAYRWGRR